MTSAPSPSFTRTPSAGVHTPRLASRLERASVSRSPNRSTAVKYKSYRNPWSRSGTVSSTRPMPPPAAAGDGTSLPSYAMDPALEAAAPAAPDPAATSAGVGSLDPSGTATKNTSAGSLSATSNVMSPRVIVRVWSHRNTGGERSSSTRVSGQFAVPSALICRVTASPTFPAWSVSVTEKTTHPFLSVSAPSSGTMTLGPAHQLAPPPESIERSSASPPRIVTSGVRTASEALKQTVRLYGLDATGSCGESDVTSSHVIIGGVTSTTTFSGSAGSRPTTASSVVASPAAVAYVTDHGTGSRLPQVTLTVALACHFFARPSPSAASSARTFHVTVAPSALVAGPMDTAASSTSSDTSSSSVITSASFASAGYPGLFENKTARSGAAADTFSTGSRSSASGPA